MQSKRQHVIYQMTLLPALEELVPSDHPLRRLDEALDLSFVDEAVREYYCPNNGRPGIDPEVLMRLFVLQALEGIDSVRELMRQVRMNLAYLWFIGYEVGEPLPDHSTLSRALDRFGDEVFPGFQDAPRETAEKEAESLLLRRAVGESDRNHRQRPPITRVRLTASWNSSGAQCNPQRQLYHAHGQTQPRRSGRRMTSPVRKGTSRSWGRSVSSQ